MKTFTAYIERDVDTGMFFGIIPSVKGAYTQGETLEELQANLREVLELCMEESNGEMDELPQFVGMQQIEVGT
jgi:predicted RNase H-like HicB family nuclease